MSMSFSPSRMRETGERICEVSGTKDHTATMCPLLDLPPELFIHILEEVGGRELRRGKGSGARRLLVCRAWYAAARPVYLSGLQTSHVDLYALNLHRLDTKYGPAGLRPLMYKNTRYFSIRLPSLDYTDAEDSDDSSKKAPPATLEDLSRVDGPRLLDGIFKDLRNFTALEYMSFEVVAQYEQLRAATVIHLLRNLPLQHNLTHLMLDICGRNLSDYDPEAAHLCPMLASLLPRIREVHLRMRIICPEVFNVPESLAAGDCRLKSLVIKIHVPWSEAGDYFNSQPCTELDPDPDVNGVRLFEDLALTSQSYLKRLASIRTGQPLDRVDITAHGLVFLRISYLQNQEEGPTIMTVDSLTWRWLHGGMDYRPYEDEGRPLWDEDQVERYIWRGHGPANEGRPFEYPLSADPPIY